MFETNFCRASMTMGQWLEYKNKFFVLEVVQSVVVVVFMNI